MLQKSVDDETADPDDHNDHDDDKGLLHCSDTMLQLSLRVPPVCLPRAINPTPWWIHLCAVDDDDDDDADDDNDNSDDDLGWVDLTLHPLRILVSDSPQSQK